MQCACCPFLHAALITELSLGIGYIDFEPNVVSGSWMAEPSPDVDKALSRFDEWIIALPFAAKLS